MLAHHSNICLIRPLSSYEEESLRKTQQGLTIIQLMMMVFALGMVVTYMILSNF